MADVRISNHGTIVMVLPVSKAAKDWVKENVDVPSWAWMGGSFACEPRLVDNLIDGMRDAGLEVD